MIKTTTKQKEMTQQDQDDAPGPLQDALFYQKIGSALNKLNRNPAVSTIENIMAYSRKKK